MTVEYRCPACGHVFKPGWIIDWDTAEIGEDGSTYFYYQHCTVDCDCGRTLRFTTFYEVTDVEVEEVGEWQE